MSTVTGRTLGENIAGLSTVAQRLHELPVTLSAWRDGWLSSGQIDAVMANVAPHHAELWAEHEAAVVPTLVGLSAALGRALAPANELDGYTQAHFADSRQRILQTLNAQVVQPLGPRPPTR